MNIDPGQIQRMRDAFQAGASADAPHQGACPSPEHIWHAVEGSLTPGELADVVRHVAACGDCTRAWRLAEQLDPAPPASTSKRVPWLERSVGVAAGILLVVGMTFHFQDRRTEVRSREQQTVEIRVEQPSPEEDLVVRWQPFDGARYTIEVMANGTLVYDELSLVEPEARVARERLAKLGLGAGSSIEIYVEAYRTEEGTFARGRSVFQLE